MISESQRTHWGTRLIALVLGLGGILGVCVSAVIIPGLFEKYVWAGLLACIFSLVLAGTVWIAIGLWRAKSWSVKWAMIVLAM